MPSCGLPDEHSRQASSICVKCGGLQEGLHESKVALVNRALQKALRRRSPELYMKPLLTSHATQGELEEALQLVKDAKEAQLAREASNGEASTSGEDLFQVKEEKVKCCFVVCLLGIKVSWQFWS